MKKFIILISALIFSAGVAHTDALTIVRDQYFPPYHFLDSTGKETGQADAMMNLFKTKERMTFMYFADNELAREINRFFILRVNSFIFDGNLNRLGGIRIGVITAKISINPAQN